MSFAELSSTAAAGVPACDQAPATPAEPAPTPEAATVSAAPAGEDTPAAPAPSDPPATQAGAETAASAPPPEPPPEPPPDAAPPRPATQDALPPPDLPDAVFRLPNARAGSAYAQRLAAVDGHEAIVFDEVVVPDGLALTADLPAGTIAGTPLAAGEYTIVVDYHFARQSPARRRRALVPVSVTPDPRTMWQNLPSARTDPYWKEDEQDGSVRGPDLSIIAASKRGRSHAHVGSFRDDDYRIAHLADSGWYVAVLADGAGSARYSRRGSAIICEHANNHILAALNDETSARIDRGAHAYARAQAAGLAPDEVADLAQYLESL